jgi:hypothetical protein
MDEENSFFKFHSYVPREEPRNAKHTDPSINSSTKIKSGDVNVGEEDSFFTFPEVRGGHDGDLFTLDERNVTRSEPNDLTTSSSCIGWSLTRDAQEGNVDVELCKLTDCISDEELDPMNGNLNYVGFSQSKSKLYSRQAKMEGFENVTEEDLKAAKDFSKSSDFAMKDYAVNTSVETFFLFQCKSRDCKDKGCIARICREGNLDDVFDQRRYLWGPKDTKAPTSKQRGDRLFQLQQKSWLPSDCIFKYSFRSKSSQAATVVCENAYMHLLGFKSDTKGICRSGQFADNKDRIKDSLGYFFFESSRFNLTILIFLNRARLTSSEAGSSR